MADERSIWGVHMGFQHELKPISKGFVAIGWPQVGDLRNIPATRAAYKKAVADVYPSAKPGALPVWAGVLFRFVHEMKKGDLVVFPSKPDHMVNLGVIDSEYVYDQSSDSRHPNRRKVKWLHHLPRAQFSQSALYEIGAAITLFQIRSNSEEFYAAFEGKPFEGAEVDDENLEEASQSTEETTRDFIVKRLKVGLSAYQFEHFVGHLLECIGYHSRVTQRSGDGGVDVIAHKDELGFQPPIIKVQCKQAVSVIGQPDVAQLYGHVDHSEHGLFVTLGSYSAQARQFERSKANLRLIDGDSLVDLIFSHYDDFEPRYQTLLPLKKIYIPSIVPKDGHAE